ncbi:MAG: terminase small subunit [Thermomicrobiales bacterium]
MSDAPEPKPLNPRQEAFVRAYCGEARFNATAAAITAGYSERSAYQTGHTLKNHEPIRARINEILDAESLTGHEVLHELTDVAMRGLDEFVEASRFDKDGNALAARMDASAKMRALETLAKARGLLTERKEISGPNGGPIQHSHRDLSAFSDEDIDTLAGIAERQKSGSGE